jgi:hypothetical protein
MIAPAIALGEQTHVTRFDVFGGYSYFSASKIDMSAKGVHLQFGVRPKKWYSLGLDYSNVKGDMTITPGLLPESLQSQLGATLKQLGAAGLLPAGYSLVVPTDVETQTLTVGPQLAYRRWVPITPFIRPSCGLFREHATPKPGDAITRSIVQQLAPEGSKTDWTFFWGFGGGFDVNFGPYFALRIQADYVWTHVYPEILKDGFNTVRFSIGPAINFGKNIVKE